MLQKPTTLKLANKLPLASLAATANMADLRKTGLFLNSQLAVAGQHEDAAATTVGIDQNSGDFY
jgi:hypothetical protein